MSSGTISRRGAHLYPDRGITWKRRISDILVEEHIIPPGFDGEIVMVIKGGGVALAKITSNL